MRHLPSNDDLSNFDLSNDDLRLTPDSDGLDPIELDDSFEIAGDDLSLVLDEDGGINLENELRYELAPFELDGEVNEGAAYDDEFLDLVLPELNPQHEGPIHLTHEVPGLKLNEILELESADSFSPNDPMINDPERQKIAELLGAASIQLAQQHREIEPLTPRDFHYLATYDAVSKALCGFAQNNSFLGPISLDIKKVIGRSEYSLVMTGEGFRVLEEKAPLFGLGGKTTTLHELWPHVVRKLGAVRAEVLKATSQAAERFISRTLTDGDAQLRAEALPRGEGLRKESGS